MSSRQWLLTFPRIRQNFSDFLPLNLPHPRIAAFQDESVQGFRVEELSAWEKQGSNLFEPRRGVI